MTVKLSMLNRISLTGLLTTKGDITMLRANRELREELGLTAEERKESGFMMLPGSKAGWQKELPHKSFVFEGLREILLNEVITELTALEKQKTLELDYISLYEVLVESPNLKLVEKEKQIN